MTWIYFFTVINICTILGWTSGTSYTKQFIGMAKLLHWNGRFKPWGRVSQHKDVWNKYYIEDPTGKFKPARKN